MGITLEGLYTGRDTDDRWLERPIYLISPDAPGLSLSV